MRKKTASAYGLAIFLIFVALYVLLGDSINYTHSFDENKFNHIHIGQTCNDVKTLIGAPFSRFHYQEPGGIKEIWFYSRSPLGLPYKRRWVSFLNGQVNDVLKDNESWGD